MLRINHKSDSIVVDQLPIHLDWSVNYKQKAYDLSVMKDNEVIHFIKQTGNVTNILLDSFELKSNSNYKIDLSVYGFDGTAEIFSRSFRTGNFGDFTGDWISHNKVLLNEADYYQENRNPLMRKTFEISDTIEESFINIIGLGYYKLYVNGNEVGDAELNTDWTNYNKTVYYDTYDITSFLKQGMNEVLVELGNGWFNPAPLTLFGKYNLRKTLSVGEPQLVADIIIKKANETMVIPTDSSWEFAQGAYLFNNIYLGEVLDYRLITGNKTFELANPVWKSVTLTEGPKGKVVPSFIPKIKKTAKLRPQHFHVVDENEVVIDFGKILTGFIDLTLTACDGQEIELTYSEEINDDFTLNTDSTLAGFVGKEVECGFILPGGEGAPSRADQKDKIICRNGSIRYINKFTFHSFRYVYLKGLNLDQINEISAHYVHTDLHRDGSFVCDDSYLNELYEVANRTKLNNIHSVLSDCARERFAYGGDIVALAKSQVYEFDSANLYEKTMHDFINDIRPNGGIPETAPFMGIKTNGTGGEAGPLGWQLVVPYLLNIHYQHYGNLQVIKNIYPYLEQQMAHFTELGIDELSKCCLGDWGSCDKSSEDYKSSSPAIRFTATCFYYFHVILMARFSNYLGLTKNSDQYLSQAESLKKEIIHRYKNDDGSFSDQSQTSYVFAIYFNLVDDEQVAVQRLADLITNHGFLIRCGIFGQSFIYEILRKYELNDLVYQWLLSEQGVQSMLTDNSATLKEYFGDNQHGSCNHAMFSSYVSWFYQGLGGISVQDQAIGSDQIIIEPFFADTINYVECEHKTNHGQIYCKWYRFETHIELVISVPFNLKTCTLVLDKRYNLHEINLPTIASSKSKTYFDVTDVGEVLIKLKH